MVIDNILDISLGDSDVLGVVIGRLMPTQNFVQLASVFPNAPTQFFPGTITNQKNEASIWRQIDAVHLICGVHRKAETLDVDHVRWWPILLNKNSRHAKTKAIPNCDEELLTKTRQWAIERLRHGEQIKVIKAANDMHGKVGLVSGPPGTGKTLTGVHLSVLYWKNGGHVIYLAPTQLSCDHALDVFKEVAMDIPVVRVFRILNEMGSLAHQDIDLH